MGGNCIPGYSESWGFQSLLEIRKKKNDTPRVGEFGKARRTVTCVFQHAALPDRCDDVRLQPAEYGIETFGLFLKPRAGNRGNTQVEKADTARKIEKRRGMTEASPCLILHSPFRRFFFTALRVYLIQSSRPPATAAMRAFFTFEP